MLLCLCLSYLGQGAWLLRQLGEPAGVASAAADPFFQMLPPALRLPALALALAAAWGASQTVVNGSFTIVSEAIRLNLLPPLEIRYPSDSIRQEYIPSVNVQMWFFSCAAVAAFQSGRRMASVYGLTIAIAMLTTSVMLFVYFRAKKPRAWPLRGLVVLFGVMETCFLIANLEKLLSGGVVTLLLTLLLLSAMLSWSRAEEIERRFSARLPLGDYLSQLQELRADTGVLKLADNLIYLDGRKEMDTVDQTILYSVLDRGPKRAGLLVRHGQHRRRAQSAELSGGNLRNRLRVPPAAGSRLQMQPAPDLVSERCLPGYGKKRICSDQQESLLRERRVCPRHLPLLCPQKARFRE